MFTVLSGILFRKKSVATLFHIKRTTELITYIHSNGDVINIVIYWE